jgi:hypothetical protein
LPTANCSTLNTSTFSGLGWAPSPMSCLTCEYAAHLLHILSHLSANCGCCSLVAVLFCSVLCLQSCMQAQGFGDCAKPMLMFGRTSALNPARLNSCFNLRV